MSGSIPYKTSLLPLTHQVLEHSEIQIQMPTVFLFHLQSEKQRDANFPAHLNISISISCILNHGCNLQVCYSTILGEFLSLEASFHLWACLN